MASDFIFLSLILVIALAVGLVACGNEGGGGTPKTHTLSFEMNGHGTQIVEQVIKEGELATKPEDPISETHNFKGWYTNNVFNVEFDFTSPIVQDTVIYAKWEEKESTYTITFDTNGHGRAPSNQQIEAGTEGKITKPDDLSANGWRFLGWSLDINDKANLIDFDSYIPTSSITLYAQWARLYTVSFDLNNSEAFTTNTPASQSIEEGYLAVAPENPVVYGYEFWGWCTDAEGTLPFDFNTPITERTVLYAKWKDNTYSSIDGEGIGEYETSYQGAYGERPDLDGFIIDGKRGEKEKWEEQNVYTHTITDAPSISMTITTKFSPKGLYVFATAKDNGGIYWTGRNWFYQNTHFEFYIARPGVTVHHDKDVRLVKIDSHNLYPSFTHVKAAVHIAEGEVNSTNNADKFAQMNVEFFITWKELRMETEDGSIPEFVTIDPVYHYKRMQYANFTYSLRTLFAETKTLTTQLPNYLVFDSNGYTKVDLDGAVLGDSSLGIAKTGGWDITNATNEYNACVISEKTGTQAIFYKNVSGDYYSFETEIIPNKNKLSGKAGVFIYNSDLNYSSLQFDINGNTYDPEQGFVLATPRMYTTNKDGGLDIVNMKSVPITNGRLVLRTVFNDGYIFYIVNGNLIHCQLVETLNVRTTPGLITSNAVGVKFINNTYTNHTATSVAEETSKFAYIISKGKTNNLTVSFNTVGVPNTATNSVIMYYQNSDVALSVAQKNNIVQTGDFTGVNIRQVESITLKTVNGVVDITDDFIANASYGEYEINNLTSDIEVNSTSSVVDVNELIYIRAKIYNASSMNTIEVGAKAIIKSSNPRLSHYEMVITGGEAVIVLARGFDYDIYIEAQGYRNYYIDKIENITSSIDLGSLYMTANIVGGSATNKSGTVLYASSPANWDMSTESLGYVDMSTPNTAFSPVYFSGVTVDRYQVMELQVANTTDIQANPSYESDPGAGFRFTDNSGSSYIELSKGRIRILRTASSWEPEYVTIPGSSGTVDILPVDPYDPSTYYYTKLTVIKIDKMCYCFVNDQYITSVELYLRDEECGIAIAGHSSYYLSMRYKDYWIKVGDEALDYAKDKVAVIPVLDDTCYDMNENYDIDYTKPYIKLDGLVSVGENENRQGVAFIGSSITVTLTEHAVDGIAYIVSVGDKKAVLTLSNPSFDFDITEEMNGNIDVKILQNYARAVSGIVINDDGTEIGKVSGEAISSDGKIAVPFTTGEDGTFSIDLAPGIYSIKVNKEAYACEAKNINVGSQDISGVEVNIYRMPIGGANLGSSLTSSTNMSLGYGYNDGTLKIDGAYMEANVIEGDSKYALNVGMMDDFVFEFRYLRKEVHTTGSVINETNPGIGVRLYVGNKTETVMFYNTGVRILYANMPAWSDRIEYTGLSANNVKDFDKEIDFRIIRRNNVFFMYSKSADESEYNLIYIYESVSGFGVSEVYLINTNTVGRANRFFVWNINVMPFDDETFPSYLKRNVTIENKTEELGSCVVVGDTAMDENGRVYAMGDNFTLALNANEGAIAGYVKINGEYVQIVRNRVDVSLRTDDIHIEIFFEKQPVQVSAKLKVEVSDKTKINLPSKVDICARIVDGRIYEFKNTVLDENGETILNIREGEFDIWVDSEFVTSKAIKVNIFEQTTDLGTVMLDVLKVGHVTVNGVSLTYSKEPGVATIRSDGAYTAPSRTGQDTWVPATKITGDFVFSTTVILSGNPNSNYYAQDNCTGVTFSDGTSKFAIQFWGQGFRVYNGIYNNKIGMIQPKHNGAEYFSHSELADVEHTLTVARKGTTLKVYVDGVYRMTLDENGYSIVNEGASMYVSAEQVASVASLLVDVFGDNSKEIVVGYSTCIDANAYVGDVNKAGFKNTSMTDDANEVAKYFA